MDKLRQFTLRKYKSGWAHSKTLAFAKVSLKYLARVRLGTRYQAFELFLEMPKVVKARKRVTNRIITKKDVETVLSHIEIAETEGRISSERTLNYTAFVLFGAYTGQRSLATMSKLTVGQLRKALHQTKPVLHVKSSQDKIRMEHYVPLHPQLIDSLHPLVESRPDDDFMFEYEGFIQWVKRQKIPLSRISGHFVLGDLRKFAEQYGDIIQWEQSNRAYILTHGVSGVQWSH